ncbi:SRPBCC family protein [Nocardioides sp. GXZ039]|uniref:SRPBCC family protein n=1 Tax=Nocardioides sp. GXZ039 TaxID=3136018 RepID=UPI0030F3BFD7
MVRDAPERWTDLEATIDVDASVSHVWDVVSDVRRMSQWSPQVEASALRAGVERMGLGAKFVSSNSHGPLRWQTHGEVVRYSPEDEMAFRIEENWVVWSFRVEPTGSGGTRLIQRRETPDGISPLSLELTETYFGGQEAFSRFMLAGMRQTLRGIKATAEAGSDAARKTNSWED